MGSKPGGIVKVADSFDPFKFGGPAGPVRRKYAKIPTYDGLTIALRPIAQNPQIAGIIVSGFSYSESFIDELPTIMAKPSEVDDFSVLSRIGPNLPADPLMIYDPTLNPKFKENKPSLPAAPKLRTPVQAGASGAQTSVQTQQTLFTASGSKPRTVPTAIDLTAHKNSLLNRPASRSLSPLASSPFAGLQSSTVRIAVAKAPSPSPSLKSQSTSTRLRRHGRRLASIPVQMEDQPPLQARNSLESTIPDHIPSVPNHGSLTALSQPPHHDSSSGAYANYNAGLQPRESEQNQASGDAQDERFAGTPSAASHSELEQHNQGSLQRNSDPYSQGGREMEQVVQQAQSESAQGPPHPVSQTASSMQPSEAYSGVPPASNAAPSANMMNPSVHVQAPDAKIKETNADSMAGQENDALSFQSPGEGRYRAAPSGKAHGISAEGRVLSPTEGVDSQKGAAPTLQSREGRSSRNAGIANGDSSYLKYVDNIEPSESSTGVRTQRDLESGGSVRSFHTGQQRSATWPDSYHSGLPESPSLVDARIHAPGLQSHQVKMATERHDEVGNYKRNLMSNPSAGFSTQNWHTINAVSNPDTAVRANRQMTEMRREERDPPASRGSVGRPSEEYYQRGAMMSGFRNTNTRAASNSMTDAKSPGVHNGIGRLDGLCIDNSTHCSCGIAEQRPDAQEECLFVSDENSDSMACTIRPCNAKIICACAPGASGLCQRSVVKNILVRAPTSESMNDPTNVACRRETLEEGVMVLTPIL